MAFDYEGARETAKALIAEFGEAGQVIKKGTKGGYDSEGNVTPDVADVVIDGIVTPLLKYKSNEIDGTSIKMGDSYIFMSTTGLVEIGMIHENNGSNYRVVNIEPLVSVGGITVYQKFQLRS